MQLQCVQCIFQDVLGEAVIHIFLKICFELYIIHDFKNKRCRLSFFFLKIIKGMNEHTDIKYIFQQICQSIRSIVSIGLIKYWLSTDYESYSESNRKRGDT